MSDEEPSIDEAVKQAVEERVRETLPAIQEAIRAHPGKVIPEKVLEDLISPVMLEVATEITMIQATSVYQGPMPSPHVMAGYAQIFPGAPEQLFRQFEAEQTHRHNWEDSALKSTKAERTRRDVGAYLVAGAGLLVAAYIAHLGGLAEAALLAGAIVLGGGALVLGRQFFASHSKDGTQVSVNEDGGRHSDMRTQSSAKKRRQGGRKR